MTDSVELRLARTEASRRRILAAADADRRELERLLHDGLQQDLVAMSATVQLLSTHLDGSTAAGEVLADLKQAALEAQRDAAKLAQTLYPPLLGARGLAGAIRAAAGLARVDAAVNVLEPSSFSADARNALYWLGVDALSAVPPGSEASIRVQGVGSSVALEVITPARFEESPLQRLRDRVETLGGEVAKAENGNGQSRIYVTLPLPG